MLVNKNQVMLETEGQGVVVEKKTRKSVSKANKEMTAMGKEVVKTMKEEGKEVGNLSNTLHFVTLLGLESKVSRRKTVTNYVPCKTVVGVRLKTDISISVPVIDVLKNKDTGITPSDVGSRPIKKGETFDLNMYELMYLIIRPEYGGFLSRNGDAKGVYFAPKMTTFKEGRTKLPTPALTFKHGTGAIKKDILSIDKKEKGVWVLKPEFQAKFGALTEKKVREQKEKITAPAPTLVSLALQQVLGLQEVNKAV